MLKAAVKQRVVPAGRHCACLDAGADLPELRQALQDGRLMGISGTPFFVIGGQRRVGVPTVQQLSTLLDAQLASVGR
jgi:protein-disulfide isomerase